ncbi:MAG: response regulator [Burkholderiaceae bacterium]
MNSTGRPLVLLVEDDASLRRFVALALDELPVELQCCADVDAALAALAQQPAALLITDLMLPGRSGFELIDCLAADPALRGAARLVVFSAGLNPAVRARLLAGGMVWRLLPKPCSVAEIEACVREGALAGPPALAACPATPTPSLPTESGTELAIGRHFGGNRALYQAFLASCLRQFGDDIEQGELAWAAADLAALRRLAHSLKSVLLSLGHPAASALAGRLELAAEQGQAGDAGTLWPQLRECLRELR